MPALSLSAALAAILTPTSAPSLADAARALRSDPAAFAAADRDGDGRIDDDELERVRRNLATEGPTSAPAPRWRIGSGRDVNGDGALTPNELYAEAE